MTEHIKLNYFIVYQWLFLIETYWKRITLNGTINLNKRTAVDTVNHYYNDWPCCKRELYAAYSLFKGK